MVKNHVHKNKNHNNKILKHVNVNKNYVNVFKNLVPYIPMLGMLAISAIVTANLRTLPSSADSEYGSSAAVTVAASCSFLGTIDEAHETTIVDGQYKEDIGTTTLRTYCNDANGYEIYAQGFSGDEAGNTNLIEQLDAGSTSTPHIIATGLFPGKESLTNDTPSSWSMKLTPCTNAMNTTCNSTYLPTIETDTNGNSFENYHVIPTELTKVASYPAGTSGDYKTDSSLTTTYDVYINQTQPAGTYIGKVKYTMVQLGAIIDTKTYMQTMSFDDCKVNVGTNGNAANIGDNITVYDKRDGSDYTVRYINGLCWMTQNLRITGTIEAKDSNFSYVDSFNVSAGDLTAGNSYDQARTHDSGNITTGVWYNYAAASAGTITGSSNSTPATEDICPSNWHLPTGPSTTSGTDFNKLIGNTTSGWQNTTVGTTAFGGVGTSFWDNGSLNTTGLAHSFWLSASAYSATARYELAFMGNYSPVVYHGEWSNERTLGMLVRCVRGN